MRVVVHYLLFFLFIGFFLASTTPQAASRTATAAATAGITGFTSPVFGVVVPLPGFCVGESYMITNHAQTSDRRSRSGPGTGESMTIGDFT